MTKQQRSDLITLLRSYPAMRTALRCVSDQMEAELTCLKLLCKGEQSEEELQSIIDEHMFIVESLSEKRKLLEIRVRAIERTLKALSEFDRTLISSFYFEPYDKETPIRLMEAFSYEKSQLYHKRGQAMEKFFENYFGDFPSNEEVMGESPIKKRKASKRITSM